MKLRDLIDILDAMPEHLLDYPVLVDEIASYRVSDRFSVAKHFNLFFINSHADEIFGEAVKRHAAQALPRRKGNGEQ